MAKAGSVAVALVAAILGLFLGFVGVTFLMNSDNLANASSESETFLGVFGSSSSEAGVPTEPWMGFAFLIFGGALLMFGLRALYTAFEGRSDLG